jgi:long-chain acyl-CoA synthetase
VPRFYEKLARDLESTVQKWGPWGTSLQALGLHRWLLCLLLRRLFGGPKPFLLSGSAALKPEVADFFNRHGVRLGEAYGLTECLLPVAITTPQSHRPGSCGKPLAANDLRVDRHGEITLGGPFVATRYHGDSGPAPEGGSVEGRLNTGDLGFLDEEGFLFLKGRRSHLIKLSTGRKIHRQSIEAFFHFDPPADQFLVFGNERPFLVGLLTLQRPLTSRSERRELEGALRRQLEGAIQHHWRAINATLSPHEQVRKLALLPRPLSLASGELTVNLKIRYGAIEQRWSQEFASLWEQRGPEILWLEDVSSPHERIDKSAVKAAPAD